MRGKLIQRSLIKPAIVFVLVFGVIGLYILGSSRAESNDPDVATPTSAQTLRLGDMNSDGSIDIVDASILLLNYGKPNMTAARGDLNNDTVVNVLDASVLAENWEYR